MVLVPDEVVHQPTRPDDSTVSTYVGLNGLEPVAVEVATRGRAAINTIKLFLLPLIV